MTTTLHHDLATDLDAAFPSLVDTYGTLVVTIASRLTDASTGEDITQEVFLRTYRALASYDADRIACLQLRPWLATITRNLVRNEYRRRERKPAISLDDGGHVEPASGHDDPTAEVDALDGIDRMGRVLADLPDTQREAVVLRHVVGLPIQEVALTMGCPTGTAKSHVSRGLVRLRSILDAQEARQ